MCAPLEFVVVERLGADVELVVEPSSSEGEQAARGEGETRAVERSALTP